MRMFYLAEPLGELPPAFAALRANQMYFCSSEWIADLVKHLKGTGRSAAIRILTDSSSNEVVRSSGAVIPPRACESTPAAFEGLCDLMASREQLRIAVCGQAANALGDSIQYQALLRHIRRIFETRRVQVHLTLYSNFPSTQVEDYFRSHKDIYNEIRPLPAPAEDLAGFDLVFDGARAYSHEDFNWQDAMLNLMGVPPSAVPMPLRFPSLSVPEEIGDEVSAMFNETRSPRLLLHTRASTPLRTMPARVCDAIVLSVHANTGFSIFSVDGMPYPDTVDDFSALSRKSLYHYFACVRQADAFISVDTSAIHVASAFQKPGLGIFAGTPGRVYLENYPWMRGIDLDPDGRLGRRVSSDDPELLRVVDELWNKLDWSGLEKQISSLEIQVLASQTDSAHDRKESLLCTLIGS